MMDIKNVITLNTRKYLAEVDKTEKDLARYLDVSEKDLRKMLDSSEMLSVKELQSIADYFDLEIKDLAIIPDEPIPNVVQNLKKQVTSKEAKEGVEILDELADKIIFYKNVKEKSERMKETWIP